MTENDAILNTHMYKEKLETYVFAFLDVRGFQKCIGIASNKKIERNYKSVYSSVLNKRGPPQPPFSLFSNLP